MLFEWYEEGIHIQLYSPQPNVEQMLWFRMFFTPHPDGHFYLSDEAVRHNTPNEQVEYHKREFMGDEELDNDNADPIRFGLSPSGQDA